jgi:hypothetical protein
MDATIYLLILVVAFIGIVIWCSAASAKRASRRTLGFLSMMTRVVSHDDAKRG